MMISSGDNNIDSNSNSNNNDIGIITKIIIMIILKQFYCRRDARARGGAPEPVPRRDDRDQRRSAR